MERMAMSKVREILRLRWEQQRSVREVARATSSSVGVVSTVTGRAREAGLDAKSVAELDDDVLEARVYGPRTGTGRRDPKRPLPDPVWMHTELRRPGVTLELLHLEYLEAHANGYRYTAFCDVYRRWLSRQQLSMRQVHRGGERMYVDYSGKKARVVEPSTGEAHEVELFVAIARLHATCLEGAEVGTGGNFAVSVLRRQPDFKVVGFGRREAHVAGTQSHASVGQFQFLKNDFGLASQFFMRLGGFFRMNNLHQFNLVKLMLADHAAHIATAGTGFGPVARRV